MPETYRRVERTAGPCRGAIAICIGAGFGRDPRAAACFSMYGAEDIDWAYVETIDYLICATHERACARGPSASYRTAIGRLQDVQEGASSPAANS